MPVKKNVFLDRLLQHLQIANPFMSLHMQNNDAIKTGGTGREDISGFYIFDVDTSEITGLVISSGDKHLYISDISQIHTKINDIQKFIETGESNDALSTDQLTSTLNTFVMTG